MKSYKTDLIIFLFLILLALVLVLLPAQNTIQLHDTYFVIDKLSLAILFFGPLTFLIFLIRGLATKFNSITSNAGLIIGLMLLAWLSYGVIGILNVYGNGITPSEQKGFVNTEQFYQGMQSNIRLAWGFLILFVVSILALIVRTFRILNTDEV
jgi:hypothetical protein